MDQNRFYIIQTISRIWIWFPIILIALIGLIKSCLGNGIDPMDDSVNTAREIVSHVEVLDSTNNGFRVVYATVKKFQKNDIMKFPTDPIFLNPSNVYKTKHPYILGVYCIPIFMILQDMPADLMLMKIYRFITYLFPV